MSLERLLRSKISSDDWDAIVHGSPDGWTFSLFGWQELILAVPQWGLEDFSFGLRENGKMVAVVPLQFNPNNGSMSSSGWGGSGPVLLGALTGKTRQRVMLAALGRCVDLARERGASQLDLSVSPVTRTSIESRWGVNPFSFYDFDDRSGLSHVIDLGLSVDELKNGLTADARRQIRLAQEHGVTVERADWGCQLDRYYALHQDTYQRTGVLPHPKEYFAGLATYMAPSNHSVLWLARSREGEPIAYHNAAWFGEGGYYHTGCSASTVNDVGVSYVLFWEALLGAKAAGLRWYDCGAIFPHATEPKQRGLTTFKTKFGGEAHRLFKSEVKLSAAFAPVASMEDSVAGLSKGAASVLKRLLNHMRGLCVGGGLRKELKRFMRFFVSKGNGLP